MYTSFYNLWISVDYIEKKETLHGKAIKMFVYGKKILGSN